MVQSVKNTVIVGSKAAVLEVSTSNLDLFLKIRHTYIYDDFCTHLQTNDKLKIKHKGCDNCRADIGRTVSFIGTQSKVLVKHSTL